MKVTLNNSNLVPPTFKGLGACRPNKMYTANCGNNYIFVVGINSPTYCETGGFWQNVFIFDPEKSTISSTIGSPRGKEWEDVTFTPLPSGTAITLTQNEWSAD
jgi:hypothetical protein